MLNVYKIMQLGRWISMTVWSPADWQWYLVCDLNLRGQKVCNNHLWVLRRFKKEPWGTWEPGDQIWLCHVICCFSQPTPVTLIFTSLIHAHPLPVPRVAWWVEGLACRTSRQYVKYAIGIFKNVMDLSPDVNNFSWFAYN